MKIFEENDEYLVAYVVEEEMLDGDEVVGMLMDNGVMVYLVRRKKETDQEVNSECGR